jgi:hypothetical protein
MLLFSPVTQLIVWYMPDLELLVIINEIAVRCYNNCLLITVEAFLALHGFRGHWFTKSHGDAIN